MAARPALWLRPALGLRLLLVTAFQAVSALGAEFSLTCFSLTLLAEGAVRKKHSLKPKSCMQELFLKSVDENWGGSLKSKYVRGSDPVLKLLDDNGNIAEELSILKWNTDSVEEFLSEKLERI
ncbi:15 kDa selenoprotein [Sigmodon hispidus]